MRCISASQARSNQPEAYQIYYNISNSPFCYITVYSKYIPTDSILFYSILLYKFLVWFSKWILNVIFLFYFVVVVLCHRVLQYIVGWTINTALCCCILFQNIVINCDILQNIAKDCSILIYILVTYTIF